MSAQKPVVTWYWRGEPATNGTMLAVNVLSTLVLGCLAKSLGDISANNAPAFVLSKGSPMSSYTNTPTATGTRGFGLRPSGGTIFYDSVNGHSAGYDHIIVTTSFVYPRSSSTVPINAYLAMHIPTLTALDSGTYYCTYITGADPSTAASFGSSGSFTLTLTTKAGSSANLSRSNNKVVLYSLALLGASKLVF